MGISWAGVDGYPGVSHASGAATNRARSIASMLRHGVTQSQWKARCSAPRLGVH